LAAYSTFRSPDGETIDSGLLLFFPGPASFTGEDVAEFQVHGGRAVVAALLQALTGLPAVRHAEPGEFTRRAFLNGKLDLIESEALADLISSETEAQRRLAVSNASGVQSGLYAGWRRRIIHAMAMIEAELDFSDEADIPGSVANEVWADVSALREDIKSHIDGYHSAEIIRDGYDVVIVGAPNAGKSSLLNALAKRDAAIVSDEPGTTRDLVEVALDLEGLKVRLTDTAGIRESAGKVEAIGIERALDRGEAADLVLEVFDASLPTDDGPYVRNANVLRVGTKCDLLGDKLLIDAPGTVFVSAVSGAGVSGLLGRLGELVRAAAGKAGDVLPSRLRHVELLQSAVLDLTDALLDDGRGLELRADDLRQAANQLGRISGAVNVEDLLDVIFAQFCVGK